MLKSEYDKFKLDKEQYRDRQAAAADYYKQVNPNSSRGEQTGFGLLLLLRNAIVLYKAPAPDPNEPTIAPPPIVFKPQNMGIKDDKP